MAYVITDQCIDELDASCVACCPVDCYPHSRSMRLLLKPTGVLAIRIDTAAADWYVIDRPLT